MCGGWTLWVFRSDTYGRNLWYLIVILKISSSESITWGFESSITRSVFPTNSWSETSYYIRITLNLKGTKNGSLSEKWTQRVLGQKSRIEPLYTLGWKQRLCCRSHSTTRSHPYRHMHVQKTPAEAEQTLRRLYSYGPEVS